MPLQATCLKKTIEYRHAVQKFGLQTGCGFILKHTTLKGKAIQEDTHPKQAILLFSNTAKRLSKGISFHPCYNS